MMARYHKYPESKEKGIQGLPRLVIFTSEQVSKVEEEEEEEESSATLFTVQSHYSIKKSAIIMGLGTDSVIAVKTDDRSYTLVTHHHCTTSDLPLPTEQGWIPLTWRRK